MLPIPKVLEAFPNDRKSASAQSSLWRALACPPPEWNLRFQALSPELSLQEFLTAPLGVVQEDLANREREQLQAACFRSCSTSGTEPFSTLALSKAPLISWPIMRQSLAMAISSGFSQELKSWN